MILSACNPCPYSFRICSCKSLYFPSPGYELSSPSQGALPMLRVTKSHFISTGEAFYNLGHSAQSQTHQPEGARPLCGRAPSKLREDMSTLGLAPRQRGQERTGGEQRTRTIGAPGRGAFHAGPAASPTSTPLTVSCDPTSPREVKLYSAGENNNTF